MSGVTYICGKACSNRTSGDSVSTYRLLDSDPAALMAPYDMRTRTAAATVSAALAGRSIAANSRWHPAVGTLFQIQLSSPLQASYAVPDSNSKIALLDGDRFDNPHNSNRATVKSAGYKTHCYYPVGSFQNWRPDAEDFQPADKGESPNCWPGE